MKNTIITLFSCFSILSFGQCPIEKGQGQFNAGVGLSTRGLPVYLGYDRGVGKDISIGGEFSFRQYNNSAFNYSSSIIGISANANYHFNSLLGIGNNIDVYLGLNLGYYLWSNSNTVNNSGGSGLGFGGQLGGRYYFNDRLGVNLEFGGGNAFSGGKLGISLRL
jgi:outer membrane immunogenic protein